MQMTRKNLYSTLLPLTLLLIFLYTKGVQLDRASQGLYSTPSVNSPKYYIPGHFVLLIITVLLCYYWFIGWLNKPEKQYISRGKTCEICRVNNSLGHINLMKRTGMLVQRQWQRYDFDTCRDCSKELYKKIQIHNLLFSWWGVISFYLAPFTLIGNTLVYIKFKYIVNKY